MSDARDPGHENAERPLPSSGDGEPLAAGPPSEPGDTVPVTIMPPGTVETAARPPSAGAVEEQEPTAVMAESRLAETVYAALAALHDDVRALRELLTATQVRLANLEDTVGTTAKQVSFLPPQVRMLGSKIDGLVTSISEPRYRAVLLSLVGVYDLIDQILHTLPVVPESTIEADHRRNYEVLRTQLRQILEMNGLLEIATDGVFDPTAHHAVRRVPCDDPKQMDCVLAVVRPGFRTEQSILRYAEVLVGQYVPPEPPAGQDSMAGDDPAVHP